MGKIGRPKNWEVDARARLAAHDYVYTDMTVDAIAVKHNIVVADVYRHVPPDVRRIKTAARPREY